MRGKTNLLLLLINTDKEICAQKINENTDIFFCKRWQLQNVYIESFFETYMNSESVNDKLFLKPKQYITFEKEGKVKVESQSENVLLTTNFKFKTTQNNVRTKKLIIIKGENENVQCEWEIVSMSGNYMIINHIDS